MAGHRTPEVVGYAYIAEQLSVDIKTVRIYAKGAAHGKPGFPTSIAPEGARSPLFLKADADRFIEQRLATSAMTRRRVAEKADTAADPNAASAELDRVDVVSTP